MNNYKHIKYKNKDYAIIDIKHNCFNYPILLDWADFIHIKKLNVKWRYISKGYVSCLYKKDGHVKELFMHEIVMKLHNKIDPINKSITHINRIGLDNRKKKRIIKLPHNCGINADDIPTYIWYIKKDDTHGDRFMVNINGYKWKTTSSKQYSTRYKLEEAKAFVRELLRRQPELFQNISMNGDYNKNGKDLAISFYDIIYIAGYMNIKKDVSDKNTNNLLKPCNITKEEICSITKTINEMFESYSDTDICNDI
jgi:hypothetical protein